MALFRTTVETSRPVPAAKHTNDWLRCGRVTGVVKYLEVMMSFDRPNPDDKHKTVSDTELNEALENDELEKGGFEFDAVEHDEGERSPGPESGSWCQRRSAHPRPSGPAW